MDRELASLHRGARRERARLTPDPEPIPEPPIVTTYTIHPRHGEPGTGFETTDADVAEEYSRHGHRVTAETTR